MWFVTEKYGYCIRMMTEEANGIFYDFKARELLIRMFPSPFSVDIDATPRNLQFEFASFQSDSTLRKISVTHQSLTSFQNMFLPQNVLKSVKTLC